MTDAALADLTASVRAAAAARSRHAQLRTRLAEADAVASARRDELAALGAALDAETADVERLQRISPTRLWATLRGDVDERRAVEDAERDAAARAVIGAEQRAAAAQAESARIARERDGLGDVEHAYAVALADLERAVQAHGGAAAKELAAIAVESGEASAQHREIEEAQAALHDATSALDEALSSLDRAGGWSTYDTFFGGGFVADMVKHSHLEKSAEAFTRVNRALEHLSVELADIDAEAVEGVAVSETLGVFDVLFDNILSDWMVRDRIARAREDAGLLQLRLSELERYLAERALAVAEILATRARRREQLLTGQ